jgi:hypothetical protein
LADVADAEAVEPGQFAGINHKPFPKQALMELFNGGAFSDQVNLLASDFSLKPSWLRLYF